MYIHFVPLIRICLHAHVYTYIVAEVKPTTPHVLWKHSGPTASPLRGAFCNTLQNTTARCNALQHTTTHCNAQLHTATYCITLHHTATYSIPL